MAKKGKKGKKGGKKGADKAKPPELAAWAPFTASTLLAEVPAPEGAKGKAKKSKGQKKEKGEGSSKTAYSPWDNELFVASAAGLHPGSMMVVGGETVQVLQVEEQRKKEDKSHKHQKGVKLVVRRACMGTVPKPLAFDAPVLALPAMVSHRPGTSPAAVRSLVHALSKDPAVGATSDGKPGEEGGEARQAPLRPQRVTKWFEENRRDLVFGLQLRRTYCEPLEDAKDNPARSARGSRPRILRFERDVPGADARLDACVSYPLRVAGWQPVFPYSGPVPDVLAPDDTSRSRCTGVKHTQIHPLQPSTLLTSNVRATAIPREKMFMYAVKHGHIETVEKLLREGLSANMLCSEAKSKFRPEASMLILAAEEGRAKVVELLVLHKADVLLQAGNDSALTVAKSGLERVRHVLKMKIEEHKAAEERRKKEEEAAEKLRKKEEEERLERLDSILRTKSVLSRSYSGITHSESAAGDGVALQAPKKGKEQEALGTEQTRIEEFVQIITILRQEYVNVIRKGGFKGDGDTDKFVKDKIMRLGIEEGWADLVEATILDGGMSANHTFSISNPGSSSWSSAPAVQVAASHGRASVLKVLIQQRAAVQVGDVDGCTPLMYAARSGTAECAQLLLDAGAVLEVKGPSGTAAHEAVCHSNAGVLSVLLKAGARVGDKNKDGQDSVMRAWTMAHGSARKHKDSDAFETLEVFRTFFQHLAETGREDTCDAYCYVALGYSISGPWAPGVRSRVCRNSTCPVWDEALEVLHPSPDSGKVALNAMFVKVEVWDWDQVGDELRIGSFVQSLNAIASQPNSTLAGAFNIMSSADITAPSADGRRTSPRTTSSSPRTGRSEWLAGILNVKLQVMTSTLVVHLKGAECLEPQDRMTKHMSDCLKSSALAGWCDIIAICAAKGGDFNTRLDGCRRRYAIMYAAATQQVDVLKLLLPGDLHVREESIVDEAVLGSGGSSRQRMGSGKSPRQRDDLQPKCAHQPADPNLADYNGVTALMWACAGRIIVPRSARMTPDEEEALDKTERRLCQLRIGYGAAEYVPENGIPADIDLRSRYAAQENKAEHNKLLQQLRLQHPELVLSRHRTVDALLNAGANPLQQDGNGCNAMDYLQPQMDHETFLAIEWLWR